MIRSLIPKASIALAIKLGAALAAFLFSLILSRYLDTAGVGQYFLALNVATLATVVARIGMDNTILRFTAQAHAQGQTDILASRLRGAFRLVVVGGIAATIVLWFAADFITELLFDDPGSARALRIIALGVVPASLVAILSQAYLGSEQLRTGTSLQSLAVPAVGCLILPILANQWNVAGAAATYGLSNALCFVVALLIWHRRLGPLPQVPTPPYRLLVRSGIPLFWAAVMNLLLATSGSVILGIFSTDADVGVFNITYRVAGLTSLALVAANSFVAPRMAALHEKGETDQIQKLAQSACFLVSMMALPALLLFLVAPEFVLMFFGDEFSAKGSTALRILTIGQFVNVATGSVGYLLMMCGYEKVMRNVLFVAAGGSLLLQLTLVPIYGLLGAAVASGLSLAAMNIGLVIVVYRKLGIVSVPLPAVLSRLLP